MSRPSDFGVIFTPKVQEVTHVQRVQHARSDLSRSDHVHVVIDARAADALLPCRGERGEDLVVVQFDD